MPQSAWQKNKPNKTVTKSKSKTKADKADGTGPGEGNHEIDYDDIQANEVEALKAIYPDEYEHVDTSSAWNRSDRSFKLNLKAASDSDFKITLVVTLTASYPKSVPVLSRANEQNLREAALAKIDSILKDSPNQLIGHEMIFEIASAVQEVLEDAVHTRAEDALLPSLDQEREIQEAATAERAREKEAKLKQKKQEESLEEERILTQMVEKEINRRKEKAHDMLIREQSNLSSEDEADEGGNQLKLDRQLSLDYSEGRTTFRKVGGFVLLTEGPVTEVFSVRPICSDDSARLASLVVKRVDFKTTSVDGNQWKKSLQSFEQELDQFKSLDHPNILRFHDYKITRFDTSAGQKDVWQVNLLCDMATKGSLDDLLAVVDTIAVEKVRTWSIQLLEAIYHLHRNSIVHKDIHAKNVLFTTSSSSEGITVKLADFGYQATLHALKEQSEGVSTTTRVSKSAYWFAPEIGIKNTEPSWQADIWDFGVVFLQMLFGLGVVETYSGPSDFLESVTLSDGLSEMVDKFFNADPKKRPTAFELLPSEFLRADIPVLPTVPNTLSRIQSSNAINVPKPSHHRRESVGQFLGASRYATDFSEAGRLGKGGFGEVVKARNKVDLHFYAIKKISQTPGSSLTEVLSEVMLLSRLNHPYVVRYYTAWIEEDFSRPLDADTEDAVFSDSASDPADSSSQFMQSTGGLDFISSRGYSGIQFGYSANDSAEEESSEEEIDTEEEDSDEEDSGLTPLEQPKRPNLKSTRTRSSSKSQSGFRTILYIQMEYCEKQTLRDLIRRGLSDDMDEVWRLFRQIVEGLNHIHGHGIIHRDLKPDNIFIDQHNIPRIGDFGLAKGGQFLAPAKGETAGNDSEMTTDVGTALYVAPELKSGSKTQYNDKVDMYSLGIIFFEMCYPLKTLMERDVVIRGLREKEPQFPPEFHSEKRAISEEIITSLISHRPSERPSSNELLIGGKLPVQVEDETIRQALAGLVDPESPYYQKVMSSLFSQPVKQVKDFTWDMGTVSYGSNELLLQSHVKEKLVSIFRHHGAVESPRPLLFPRSPYYTTNVVQIMDPSGTLLQLPYDLTLPYARAIARQTPPALKTYAFGTVYRDVGTGGQPASHGEVDFDIVSSDSLDLALKEAEVIKVIDEVVHGFPSLSSAQMCFHINHCDLLELIMEYCQISRPQRPLVKEVLSKLNTGGWNWAKIRNELRSPSIGVSSTSLDDLAKFDFREYQEKAFHHLQSIFEGSDIRERCVPIFSHLTKVITYLKSFGVRRKIYISPLSTYNDKFYTGDIVFQCLYDTKRREVFAAGGRYDRLIRQHRPKTQGHQAECHAVGFSLAWESLFTSMARYQKDLEKKNYLKKQETEPTGLWLAPRCDVLVASMDPASLRSLGIQLLAELWSIGLSAELAVDVRSPDQLLSRYKDDKHSWIIIIKRDHPDYGKDRGLKVKSMVRKEDADIRMSGLLVWLRNEIREKDQAERAENRAKQISKNTLGQDAIMADVDEKEGQVLIIPPVQKNKTNRRNITQSANNRAKEVIKGIAGSPVLAIEVKEDILESIRETRLADTDSWRRLIHGVAADQKHYISEIHSQLVDLAKDPQLKSRNVMLYDYKTAQCVCYDLGKLPRASSSINHIL